MSNSYNDLPLDVITRLKQLQIELEEGDITQKGYEKKKNQLLQYYHPARDTSSSDKVECVTEKAQENNNAPGTDKHCFDNHKDSKKPFRILTEPSVAEARDLLDFLPSPSHSLNEHVKDSGYIEAIQTRSSSEIKHHVLQSPSNYLNMAPIPPLKSSHIQQHSISRSTHSAEQVYDHPQCTPSDYSGQTTNSHRQTTSISISSQEPRQNHLMIHNTHSRYQINTSISNNNLSFYGQSNDTLLSFGMKNDQKHGTRPTSYLQNREITLEPEQSQRELTISDQRSSIYTDSSYVSLPTQIRHSASLPGTLYTHSSMPSLVRRSQSNKAVGRNRYRDGHMVNSFKAIEPIIQSQLRMNDPIHKMFISNLVGKQMPPLKGRQIIAPLYDVDEETVLTDFKNLVEVLRMRSSRTMEKTQEAFVMVDSKGKEQASLTWEKTYTKAEKIARNIVDNINPGDKVALIYHKSDTLEFISALLGCFLAGVIAVPVNSTDEVSEVLFILTITQCTLILTTDQNYRVLMKEMQSKSTEFPKDTKWVKTNEMSIWNMSKKALDYRSIKALSFAYIEYTKANNGELKGVIITHESIMKQCAAFQASTSLPDNEKQLKSRNGKQPSQTIVSHLEPRQQIGLILTVFHSIYAGNKVIFTTESIADTPSVWIYLLSRYKATMALTTYPALKCISDYFQSHSKEVRSYSKKTPPDLSSLQHLLIDANVTNVRLNEYIAEWLLRPLGVAGNPLEVIYPILSLSEYGGMIISMRDSVNHDGMESGQLLTSVENSGRESYYSHTSKSTIYATNSNRNYMCIFDSDALKLGKAVVLNISSHEGTLNDVNDNKRTRIQSFGFAMPEVNIAIVDPDTDVLCPRNTLGEIWVNSTSLGNGFWGLPKHTESIFQARPIFIPSDSCYPEHHQEMYLRTGLNGTMVGGRLFVLGAFEDRIRQQRLGDDFGIEETYYSHELVQTLNEVLNINRCAIFEIYVKEQHLPIVICELAANKSELHGISKQINDVLTDIHGLRPFAVMFVGPDKLPSQVIHGRNVIHPLQTKQFFLQGLLPIRHIRLDVDRTIFHLAKHEDITRSIWLSNLAYDSAVRMGAITPNTQQQHTGIEVVTTVRDDYTGQDLFRFTNIIDILQWRTSILPDEIAYTTSPISCKASDSKSYSWQKLNHKSVAMALHLSKKGPRLGNRVIVLVSFGMEYIVSIYACLYMGLVPVPIDPIDPQTQSRQIQDFVQKLKGTIHQLKIAYIITNSNSEDMLKNSNVKNAIKQQHLKLPNCINISKMSKQHKILGKGSGPLMYPDWATAKKNNPAVILVQNSSDSIERYAYFGHDTIINHCRTEKATCQMKRGKGIIITGLGTYDGLGFLHALFMGVYIGSTTTIIPLFDYYANPAVFFECLQKYKAKDVCATNALIQFAMNRMDTDSSRHIILRCVQNMMIANDNRPSPLLYQHVTRHFGKYRLDSESINTVYSHAGNPMITTRSYMLSKPITLVLDPYWLRQGIVRVLKHKDEQSGIALNDSGIVTSNTMIAIVNPETQKLSPVNKIGEIWVSSDGNIKTFHGMTYHEQASQFGAVIVGGNPQVKYMRTGDLGFLWNVRRHSNSKSEEGQCLYVLGPMSETIMKDGLIHFATDIEQHIEQCHAAIPSRGSIVFQTHKEIVAVVSIESNLFALSIVPLIVKCILEYHMFLIDTIVIVHPNNFPRSRFGDKERGRAMNMFIEENLTAIYVKRITNQHMSLSLPQWTQSMYSFPNISNLDGFSQSSPLTPSSVTDLSSEYDKHFKNAQGQLKYGYSDESNINQLLQPSY